MDKNKLKRLEEVGYKINDCCAICIHGEFPNNDFGTCKKYTYKHQKHSLSERQLSICKTGVCKNGFEFDGAKINPFFFITSV